MEALGEPDGAGDGGAEDVLPLGSQPAVTLDFKAGQAAALRKKSNLDHRSGKREAQASILPMVTLV